MLIRDFNQLMHPLNISPIFVVAGQGAKIEASAVEYVSWKPANAARLVIPDIFQYVGHLQGLTERDCKFKQFFAIFRHFRTIVTKKFSQHFTDDPGDIVAILIELGNV